MREHPVRALQEPPMRLAIFALSALSLGLSACSSSGSDSSGGSGLSDSFKVENYRRSTDTNGTQLRPDVNRAYTQPSIPTIANRGF